MINSVGIMPTFMSETNIQPPQPPAVPYAVKKLWANSFFITLSNMLNSLLRVLGLRKKRAFWGIVYDSVTKQPLDPVIVKLVYVNTNQVAETCVTDLAGEYGFLARPGKFKIIARKSNYQFPSERVAGSKDGIYHDLYHGEFFILHGDEEVIGPNIPMDPVTFDWNQQAKSSVISVSPYTEYFFSKIVMALFWFWYILNGITLFSRPVAWNTAIFSLQTLLIVMAFFVPRDRLWGRVRFEDGDEPTDNLVLELFNKKIPGVVFGKAIPTETGKFFLRANPGNYRMEIKRLVPGKGSEFLGSVGVDVKTQGVMNDSLLIRKRV